MPSSSSSQYSYRIPVVDFLNAIVQRIAETTAWLNVVLALVILTQVVLRYGFNHGMVPLEEVMWHLYAIAFMFGMAYAVTNDSHIRVDIVHMSLSRRAQHILEILGILLLLFPFLWVIFDHSFHWVLESYRINESSENPTGLPYRWLIKSVIPISILLIAIAALARLIQESLLLFHYGKEPSEAISGRVTMMQRFFHLQVIRGDEQEAGEGERS